MSSYNNSNLKFVIDQSLNVFRFGGGNTISIVKFKTPYNIFVTSLFNNEQDVYKQGFVFTYISHTLKSLSIIKSSPNNSYPKALWFLSIKGDDTLNISLAIDFIYEIALEKLNFKLFSLRYFWKSAKDNLFPASNLP